MELTFESALSPGGLIGHASYLLLVISMLMRKLTLLRLFVIASSVTGILYDAIWLQNPVGVFWEGLLLAVNLVQLSIDYAQNRRAVFTPEESRFMQTRFPGLDRAEQRRLLNRGAWKSGEAGTLLTREGTPVSHLYYLSDGEARIESGGQTVAICEAGAFIGEMTVMAGETASGTAILNRRSRYWCVEADALRQLARNDPELSRVLANGFALSLGEKLIRSNQRIIESALGSRV